MKFLMPLMMSSFLALLSLKAVASIPKMLYGTDGRYEVDDFKVMPYRPYTDAVAGMVLRESLNDRGNYFQYYKVRLSDTGVDSSIPFSRQIVLPDCTGFLVAENVLVTAGHCITEQKDCRENLWVFDYTFKNSKSGKIEKKNTVGCESILARSYSEEDPWIDFAVIKLDRHITDRPPLQFRTDGEVKRGDKVFMIGHPLGLPMKITIGAEVWQTEDSWAFSANLDAFGGNSGSPVLNQETGLVEGILVRGSEDFAEDEEGNTSLNICLDSDQSEFCTLGEDITRITKLDLKSLIESAKGE